MRDLWRSLRFVFRETARLFVADPVGMLEVLWIRWFEWDRKGSERRMPRLIDEHPRVGS